MFTQIVYQDNKVKNRCASIFGIGGNRSRYRQRFQVRDKCKFTKETELKLWHLVVIRDDKLPPLKWMLRRVIALHTGPDRITRCITMWIAASDTKSAVPRVCVLLVNITPTQVNNNQWKCNSVFRLFNNCNLYFGWRAHFWRSES